MPPERRAEFDEQKFQNAVLYFLHNAEARPGVVSLLKLLYFADYEHYRAHLAPITGAEYVALPNGPVIDNYKALFDALVDQGLLGRRFLAAFAGAPRAKLEYLPLTEPNLNVFCQSELDILAAVVSEHGAKTGTALIEKSHLEGPWSLVWDPDDQGRRIPHTLFRWIDNLPDEDDVERAKEHTAEPRIQNRIRELNQQTA